MTSPAPTNGAAPAEPSLGFTELSKPSSDAATLLATNAQANGVTVELPEAAQKTSEEISKSDEKTVVSVKDDFQEGEGAAKDTAAAAATPEEPPTPHWKTNTFLFFASFFFGYLVQFVHITATTVIAKEMAGNSLATLPGGLLFLGSMFTSMPLSLLAEKIGLKKSYLVGTTLGIVGAALCLASVVVWSFALLCLGMLFQGSQNATTQLVRYGVRAVTPTKYRNRALAWTVAGAALAAPIGPLIAQNTVYMIPGVKYMGIYVIILALIGLMDFTLLLIRFPPQPVKPAPVAGETPAEVVPRGTIIKHYMHSKKFVIALIAGSTGQVIMVLLMAPVPLAIINAGYSFNDQANVLLGHLLGMFVPSLFIGVLIDKFGATIINLTGMVLLVVASAVLMIGETMPLYFVGETLQGIGWNFSYISATAIILKMAAPGRELQTIQGLNDTISQTVGGIFGVISGPLYNAMKWRPLMALSLSILACAAVAILAIARLPLKGMRDSDVGLEGYKRQKDEEMKVMASTSMEAKEAGEEHAHEN